MISQRATHYVLWFLLLGVVVGLANLTGRATLGRVPLTETIWLFAVGVLGILASATSLAGRITRPFDLVVGSLFIVIGLLGVLHNFGINITNPPAISNIGDGAALLGLSLALPFTLLHLFLGLTSLQQGLKSAPIIPPDVTSTATTEVR